MMVSVTSIINMGMTISQFGEFVTGNTTLSKEVFRHIKLRKI